MNTVYSSTGPRGKNLKKLFCLRGNFTERVGYHSEVGAIRPVPVPYQNLNFKGPLECNRSDPRTIRTENPIRKPRDHVPPPFDLEVLPRDQIGGLHVTT